MHWCAKEGHTKLVEMLLQRGARVNATNMGDDIPLHLAAAHGHLDIVLLVTTNEEKFNAETLLTYTFRTSYFVTGPKLIRPTNMATLPFTMHASGAIKPLPKSW